MRVFLFVCLCVVGGSLMGAGFGWALTEPPSLITLGLVCGGALVLVGALGVAKWRS